MMLKTVGMRAPLQELIGRVITTGIPGPRLDAATRRALGRLLPSGIILFRRNIENLEQLGSLVTELHALPSRPLVSIDHEGETVTRLGPPFTRFPVAAEVGRSNDPDLAQAVGRAMGSELASAGIDIDFAPVLDVHSNPANPIIGKRAFATDPDRAGNLGVAFMRGLHAGGVLSCGKHFPGHGDTDRDSHSELPLVARNRAELEAVELKPFRAAVAAGVPMLMTAHVLYPALDPLRPATLSRPILHDLLRGEIGFRGVVVSDDLEMGAIRQHGAVPDAAVEALAAGVDWLLVCNDLDLSLAVAERLEEAVGRSEIAVGVLETAAARIGALALPPRPPGPLPLPSPEHERLARQVREIAASLKA
jgi:beta-N-acetylhexosaminidase